MTVKEQLIREIEEAPEAVLTKFMQVWLFTKQEKFAEMTAEDWARYQETLFVLQNESLMKQISQSFVTHNQGQGYKPSQRVNNLFNQTQALPYLQDITDEDIAAEIDDYRSGIG